MEQMDKETSTKEAVKSGKAPKEASASVGLTLLGDGVSASLRMIIPTIGLFFVGLGIDALLKQTAFYALIGAVIGFLVAAYLIFRQANNISKRGKK